MGEVAKGSGGGDVCEDSSAQSLHLRDVTLYEDPDGRIIKSTEPAIPAHPFKPVPAVVGITVKQVAFERRVTDKMRRERDEARAEAARYREALERLTKAVHNWNVALEIDDAGEIYAVNCELEAAVIAADERLGGGGQ